MEVYKWKQIPLDFDFTLPPVNLHNYPGGFRLLEKEGIKFDNDKVHMDLISPYALEGLAKVLTFGANKYGSYNWANGISYSRLIGALLRHLSAIQKGEEIDSESGLPHIDHLGCNWHFLSHFSKLRPDLNDLPRFRNSSSNASETGRTSS